MSETANNTGSDAVLSAIRHMMADLDGEKPAEAEAADVSAPSESPVLDLTRRVNEDGSVTNLSNPGVTKVDEGDAAVQAAFNTLRDAVAEAAPAAPAAPVDGLEDKLEDILRPMVKDWLDANLAPIVERVVRDEVERIARRG